MFQAFVDVEIVKNAFRILSFFKSLNKSAICIVSRSTVSLLGKLKWGIKISF